MVGLNMTGLDTPWTQEKGASGKTKTCHFVANIFSVGLYLGSTTGSDVMALQGALT